jgi:hypothetical protein
MCLRGDALAPELNDEAKLSFSQGRLDYPNDPELASDLYPLANLERLLLRQ